MELQFKPHSRLDDMAKNILRKRYFAKGETKWKHVVERVVNYVAGGWDEDSKSQLYDMIYNRYFIPNSPTLVNSGKNKNAGLSACYVLPLEDTIEDIFKTKLDFALVARKGGGCGTTLSDLRPQGDPVNGSTHGFAGGAIPFADTISHDMDVITQSGFRSMAIMFTMSVRHPDILKFITAKSQEGKIANANISVVVDDEFMRRVENDLTYWTEFKGKKYQEYKARDVFNQIVEGAWKNGEPGLLFYDRINDGPYKYAGIEIKATNPCGEQPLPPYGSCLSYDTLLSTDSGIRRIGDQPNGVLVSATDYGDVVTTNFTSYPSGTKNLLEITIDGGLKIKTTPEHKFITNIGEVEAQDLVDTGAMVKWMTSNPLMVRHHFNDSELDTAYLLGWMHGDGWMTENSIGISFNNKDGDFEFKGKLLETYHRIFGIRKALRDDNISYQEQTEKANAFDVCSEFGIKLGRTTEKELPEVFYFWSMKEQLAFLSALFTADGSVSGKGNAQIAFSTSSYVLLSQIQEVLAALGIQSRSYTTIFNTVKRNPQYRLAITKESARKFMKYIGFISSNKNQTFNWDANQYWDDEYLSVIKIQEIDGVYDVYDFTAKNTHVGFANGVLVHNCNLGSLDLSKFCTKDGEINWELLDLAVRLTTRFLDSVIEVNSFPTDEIEHVAKNSRAIGIGIMGLADLYISKKIAYGSPDALELLDSIMGFIYTTAKSESERMGNELGVPSWCKGLPEPRRNITLVSIAPTGTISIVAGCNSGIEPFFSEITERKDKTGQYEISSPAEEPYFRCAVSSTGEKEVTWQEHVATQAVAQKWSDSGVSKTINFPNHTWKETIGKAYMQAWRSGCKGITVYRNGSREVEVLSPKNVTKDKCPMCESDTMKYDGCVKCTKCDWSLCTVG